MVQQAQQKQQQQQLAAQAAQLLLNGNADGSAGGAVGDIDLQVVEQVIQVRIGRGSGGSLCAGYRVGPSTDPPCSTCSAAGAHLRHLFVVVMP